MALGANPLSIILKFLIEFGVLIVLAFLISAPAGFLIMEHWLTKFTYRIPIGFMSFIFAFLASAFFTFATISVQLYRASQTNPIKSIRTE